MNGGEPGRSPPGPPSPSARLFVAALPPPAVLERLAAEVPRPPLPGVRYTGRDQWHVTLRFLGHAPVGEAVAALRGLRAEGTDVCLGPATVVLSRRVVCLPAAGLEPLAAALTRATGHVGRPPERRRFAGHLTLARLAGRRGPGTGASDGLVGLPFEAAFPVHEVHLVRSLTRPSGAVYDVIATRSLGGGRGGGRG